MICIVDLLVDRHILLPDKCGRLRILEEPATGSERKKATSAIV
jgi:hypothetical protein